jgi:hypothetical protein
MDNRYEQLDRVIKEATDQAKSGKGCERHATGEPFENQKICVISRWLKGSTAAGPLFQAAKKIFESATLEREYNVTGHQRAIHELQGAINYLAAAILLMEEDNPICTTNWEIKIPFPKDDKEQT